MEIRSQIRSTLCSNVGNPKEKGKDLVMEKVEKEMGSTTMRRPKEIAIGSGNNVTKQMVAKRKQSISDKRVGHTVATRC